MVGCLFCPGAGLPGPSGGLRASAARPLPNSVYLVVQAAPVVTRQELVGWRVVWERDTRIAYGS